MCVYVCAYGEDPNMYRICARSTIERFGKKRIHLVLIVFTENEVIIDGHHYRLSIRAVFFFHSTKFKSTTDIQ